MALVKSPMLIGTGSLAIRKAIRPPQTEQDLELAECRYGQAFKTKSTHEDKPTPKQLKQRIKFSDADCYYREMNLGQRIKWIELYQEHKKTGRVKERRRRKKTKAQIPKGENLLNDYSYFMKKALLWNLKEYIKERLGAKWKLRDVIEEDDKVIIRVGLTGPEKIAKLTEELDIIGLRGLASV